MAGDEWLEARNAFLRDLEHEAVELRKRAMEAERELHDLGESLQGDTVKSLAEAGDAGEKDPRLLRHVVESSVRAATQADNLTEELRGLIQLHEDADSAG